MSFAFMLKTTRILIRGISGPQESISLRRPVTLKVDVVVFPKWPDDSPTGEQPSGTRGLVQVNMRSVPGGRYQSQSKVEGATVLECRSGLYAPEDCVEDQSIARTLKHSVRGHFL
jgi:hypothetical protein